MALKWGEFLDPAVREKQCDYCEKDWVDETCYGIRYCYEHETKAWKRDLDFMDSGNETQECYE